MARCAEFSAALSLPCANNFDPLSLQSTDSMATVHDEIDNWLAADLHDELSNEEQHELHTHLVECADCRQIHQETKTMNKILEETLAQRETRSLRSNNECWPGFETASPERTGVLQIAC